MSDTTGGGDAVNKTVGVHVKTSHDRMAALDEVIDKLRMVQNAANGVTGPITIVNSFNGASAAASRAAANMKALTTETQAATQAQQKLNTATDQLSVLGQNMRAVKRVTTETAAGKTTDVNYYTNAAGTVTRAESSTGAKRTTVVSPEEIEYRNALLRANETDQKLARQYKADWTAAIAEDKARTSAAAAEAQKRIAVKRAEFDAGYAVNRAEQESTLRSVQVSTQAANAKAVAANNTIAVKQKEAAAAQELAAKTAKLQATLSADKATMQAISQSTGLPITRNLIRPEQLQILQSSGAAVMTLNEKTGAATLNMRSLQTATAGFGGEMLNVIGKVALWSVATGAIFGTIHAVKEAIATYAAFETQTLILTRVGRNLATTQDGVAESAQRLTRDILALKVAYGSVGTGALQAATVFARLGYTAEETKKAVEQTLMLANLTGVAPERVGADIEAIILQFRMEASAIADVAEKLYAVDKAGRVTTEDLLQGASRVGAAWRESGGTFEELNAVIGALVQATGRHGGEVANAVKFITSREANMELMRKIYEMTGVDVHGKNPIQFWDEVAAAMANMDADHRKQVLTTNAGNRQWSFLAALLDNMPLVHRNIAIQMGATGDAMKDNEAIMGSLTKRWDQLKAAIEAASDASLKGGGGGGKDRSIWAGVSPGTGLKQGVSVATYAISAFTDIMNAIDALAKGKAPDFTATQKAAEGVATAAGASATEAKNLVAWVAQLSKLLPLPPFFIQPPVTPGTPTLGPMTDEEFDARHKANLAAWDAKHPPAPKAAEDFAAMDRVERAIEEIGLAYERTRELAQAYGASAAETAETVARSHYEQAAALRDAASAAREAGRTDEAKKYEEAEKKETDAGRKGDIRAEREAEKEAINKVIKLRKESIEDAITEARAAADTGPAWERGLKQAQAEAEVLRRKLADAHTEEKTWTDAVSSMKEGGLAKEAAEAEAKRAAAVQIRKGLEDQLHAAARAQRREEAESIRRKDEHIKREAQHVANMLMQMSTSDILQTALLLGTDEKDVWKPKSMGDLARMDEQERRTWMNASKVQGEGGFFSKTIEDIAAKAREASNTRSITNDVMTTRAHKVGRATVDSMHIGTITMNGKTVTSTGKPGIGDAEFRQWYSSRAAAFGLNPDPDDKRHHYDYRAAWKAGAEPDATGHWPSEFKSPDHPNRYVDGVDTITGRHRSNLWYTPPPPFLFPPPSVTEPAVRPPAPPDHTPIGEARGGGAGATVPAEGANFTVNITMGGLVADGDKLATQVALLVSNAVDGVADKLIARVNAGAKQTALKGGQPSARIA